MSFSSQVKQELVRVHPEKHCCMLSEISALTQTCASLRLAGGGRVRLTYETENAALAKRIFLLLKKRMEITPTLEFKRHKRLGGRRVSVLTVAEGDTRRLLVALRMMQEEESGALFLHVHMGVDAQRDRAAFLGAGAVSEPEGGYRLEFVSSGSKAETLVKILEKSGIGASIAKRRGSDVVYIRRGDDVVSCLALMGAHKALMDMENTRIRREGRNQANRARNCDEANLKKQLGAGEKQKDRIVRYSLAHSLGALPKELQEIGRLRMLHPEASLEELGQMTTPPLGKSGVNHRLRRLMALIGTEERKEEQTKNVEAGAGADGHHAHESDAD